jgi:hypothetical protein
LFSVLVAETETNEIDNELNEAVNEIEDNYEEGI